MPLSFYDITVVTHRRGLNVLLGLLDKAEAHAAEHRISTDEICEWRLVDDMKPFTFQVQTVCNVAKNAMKIGAGLEMPFAEDDEKTFGELRKRIKSTIEILDGVDRAGIENKGGESIKARAPEHIKQYDLTAEQFVLGLSNPNFYFHLTTAYNILRSKGVQVGKRDYLRVDAWIGK
jgi:uncharacterized protein